MKKLGFSALCVLLAVTFVMCVLTFGTNERYSFMSHFEKITEEFTQTPSLQELVNYWTSEKFKPSYNGIEIIPSVGGDGTGGGFGGGIYGDGSNVEEDGYVYPNKVSDSDWGTLQPLQEFVGAVKGFFVRAYYSIVWVCNFVTHAFSLVGVLLPWNGLVERDSEAVSVFSVKEVAA